MSTSIKVAIVDYSIGNLYSVKKACEKVGLDATITSDRSFIEKSDALILPGVGAFGSAMNNLSEYDLIDCIKVYVKTGKYVMGVCLGMQLLMETSSEFGTQQGLGLIKGNCQRFQEEGRIKIPQITWNTIYAPDGETAFDPSSPLKGLTSGSYMYFVHSYYVKPTDPKDILSLTEYSDFEYCSSVKKDNIIGFQFHPEKSGDDGLLIYNNFKNMIKND